MKILTHYMLGKILQYCICHEVTVPAYRIHIVHIQKEVISDLKRENQFLSKAPCEFIGSLYERSLERDSDKM
jgi:hypothetical protein